MTEDLRTPELRSQSAPGISGESDSRAKLLAAAGPIFAALGFDRATVREICRKAKVNVAAIGYHFGDKHGLYLEVVREIRRRRDCHFPIPDDGQLPPEQRLRERVKLLLSRMLLEDDRQSWETQLLMREMQQPTAALGEIVDQAFRPLLHQLCELIREMSRPGTTELKIQQLAFSVIGQCLYYRVSSHALNILIPEDVRTTGFNIEALTDHITEVTLAAIKSPTLAS